MRGPTYAIIATGGLVFLLVLLGVSFFPQEYAARIQDYVGCYGRSEKPLIELSRDHVRFGVETRNIKIDSDKNGLLVLPTSRIVASPWRGSLRLYSIAGDPLYMPLRDGRTLELNLADGNVASLQRLSDGPCHF